MRYIPVSLDTKDKNVLVLGGSVLVLECVRKLLNSEAKTIYIIASDVLPEIAKLGIENPERVKIKILDIDEDFKFFGYDLLMIGTYDLNLNNKLEERAKNSKIFYQRLDIKGDSRFILEDYEDLGDISISVSRTSSIPEVEAEILKDIKVFAQKYNVDKLSLLKEIRTNLIRKNSENIEETIKTLYHDKNANLREFLDIDEKKNEDVEKKED